MDIEKAKINLYELQYELKLEQEENIKKHGYNPEQEIEAIETVLNELDKKDEIIIAMAEQLTTPVHGVDWVIDYFTKKVTKEENK